MSELEGEKPVSAAERAEHILAQYAAVWIWTIFFTVNGGLSYSYMSSLAETVQASMMGMGGMRVGGFNNARGGAEEVLMLVLPITYAVGVMANVASWVFLYLFFSMYVVPVVLIAGPASPYAAPAGYEDRRRRGTAHFLRRAYQLLILAGLARLTPTLVYMIYPAIGRWMM